MPACGFCLVNKVTNAYKEFTFKLCALSHRFAAGRINSMYPANWRPPGRIKLSRAAQSAVLIRPIKWLSDKGTEWAQSGSAVVGPNPGTLFALAGPKHAARPSRANSTVVCVAAGRLWRARPQVCACLFALVPPIDLVGARRGCIQLQWRARASQKLVEARASPQQGCSAEGISKTRQTGCRQCASISINLCRHNWAAPILCIVRAQYV